MTDSIVHCICLFLRKWYFIHTKPKPNVTDFDTVKVSRKYYTIESNSSINNTGQQQCRLTFVVEFRVYSVFKYAILVLKQTTLSWIWVAP